MFFHVFRHIHAQDCGGIIKQEPRQCLGQFGLADPGGAKHQEAAYRLVRISNPGPRPAGGIGNRGNSLSLANHRAGQRILHLEQFFPLPLHHLVNRDTGPAADDLGDMPGFNLFFKHCAGGNRILGGGELLFQPGQGSVG